MLDAVRDRVNPTSPVPGKLRTAIATTNTRQTNPYPVVVRDSSAVVVADGSVLSQSERHNADNEWFRSDRLEPLLCDGKFR